MCCGQEVVNLDSLSSTEQRKIINHHVNKALRQSLIPGFSQIKNKQYWKIPFCYGGLIALSTLGLDHYKKYKQYQEDNFNEYLNYIPTSYYTLKTEGNIPFKSYILETENETFKEIRKAENKHKNLSYLYFAGTGLLYFLNICDGIHPVFKEYRSPYKAGLYSTFIPGLGQLYNKQYWKIPLVYIGIGTFAFFINYNHVQYKRTLQAYMIKNDPLANEYALEYLSAHRSEYGQRNIWDKANFTKGEMHQLEIYLITDYFDSNTLIESLNKLKKEKDRWKRYRDLTIIGLAAFYGINIIDATVFSHLYDYDISNDLTIDIMPNFINNPNEPVNFGLTLTMNF